MHACGEDEGGGATPGGDVVRRAWPDSVHTPDRSRRWNAPRQLLESCAAGSRASPRRVSVDRTSISTMATCPRWKRAKSSATSQWESSRKVGSSVTTLKPGDRVVVPFTISCGSCWFCQHGLFSLCDTPNPNKAMAARIMRHSPAGLFGYSHMLDAFPGGRAEFERVPISVT